MTEVTYALIDNNVVQQVLTTDQDISTLFAAGMRWVEVPTGANAAPGYLFDGTNFTPAPAPVAAASGMSLTELQAQLVAIQSALTALGNAH